MPALVPPQPFWGLRYIDDAAARRVTSDLGEDWQRGYYHITNVQFSTETLISDARELIERVRYEAYGKARHGWPEDLDGNGSFVEADRNIGIATPAGKTIGEGADNVLMDFDYSGTIEQDECDRCQSGTGIAALDAGAIMGDASTRRHEPAGGAASARWAMVRQAW